MKKKKEIAFTLAEVLIALVIIGVISAITVPVIMQNTQKQEIVTALKKTYSTLSQVTNQIIAEEGSPKGTDSWLQGGSSFYDMYKKYLNNAQECGIGKNTPCDYEGRRFSDRNTLILADGVLLSFEKGTNNCTHKNNGTENYCGEIWADLNGAKGPNKYGADWFAFALKENGLYPHGCDIEGFCSNTARTGCACKVLREGAMNY